MAPGTRIKDLESQATSVQQAHQPLLASRPIMLLTLPAPAKDYLCLSITSFCFCILLAIPALVFSFKTREANYDGDWRRAQRNSRLALAFSVSSILVGCILMASSITLILETEEVTSS
ncbi:transmembrane protein 233 [Cricetulus griseus]|uniref:Transmembrane protein 233 n=2 Tax=Cricetulus griseus TaxID=10029 RepID=A0A9J7H9E3_CRIGR|nr:transmembrane protein 233 [Cricetulus griseus]XP_035313737.1 transmembrane protein 233 [Cricetulus griseus]